MNVASLELCKELYELSGWTTYPYYWSMRSVGKFEQIRTTLGERNDKLMKRIEQGLQCPSYSLGFLMDRLPHSIEIRNHFMNEDFGVIQVGGWANDMRTRTTVTADTPEDAAAKLTIELFKQGILTKEQS